jgi:hypothetical protein
MKQRGLSPNSYIHVSVSELYIPKISLHYSAAGKYVDRWWEYLNRLHIYMNVDIGTEAPQFCFWEYRNRTFSL